MTQGRRIARVLGVLAAIGLGVAYVEYTGRNLGLTGRVDWPPITDPAALRREATALCQGGGGWRELQPAEYPPAMTALHPASISISSERVYVALVPGAGGRQRYHGYYIWPDRVNRADGGIVREESNGEHPDL